MKELLVMIVLASVILFSSCKTDSPVSGGQPVSLFSLAIGNWETMKITVYDSTGGAAVSMKDSFYVFADTVIAGDHWFLSTYGRMAFANKSDGVWGTKYDYDFNTKTNTLGSGSLYFKYPAQKGDIWGNWSLIVKDTAITVPHDSHTCWLYRTSEVVFGGHSDYYIEVRLGIVAIKDYSTTSSRRTYLRQSSELVSYKVL